MIARKIRKFRESLARKAEKLRVDKKIQQLQSGASFEVGSSDWLRACELKMGGLTSNVARNIVSALDPRSKQQLATGGMVGGDRMIHHNYADAYAKHLSRFIGKDLDLVVVECGILKGTGLGVWSKLFPQATLVGLDIDLSYTLGNLNFLKERGAFEISDPILLTFDQFKPDVSELKSAIGSRKIDIVIDDGFHSVETILNTFDALRELLSDDFVYFAEDNSVVAGELEKKYPDHHISSYGELTVISSSAQS